MIEVELTQNEINEVNKIIKPVFRSMKDRKLEVYKILFHFIKLNKVNLDLINELNLDDELREKVIFELTKLEFFELPKCPICGSDLMYQRRKGKFFETCSKKCGTTYRALKGNHPWSSINLPRTEDGKSIRHIIQSNNRLAKGNHVGQICNRSNQYDEFGIIKNYKNRLIHMNVAMHSNINNSDSYIYIAICNKLNKFKLGEAINLNNRFYRFKLNGFIPDSILFIKSMKSKEVELKAHLSFYDFKKPLNSTEFINYNNLGRTEWYDLSKLNDIKCYIELNLNSKFTEINSTTILNWSTSKANVDGSAMLLINDKDDDIV